MEQTQTPPPPPPLIPSLTVAQQEEFSQEDLYTMTAHGVAWFIQKRNNTTGRVCLRRVRRSQGHIGLETKLKWVTPVKGSPLFPAFLRDEKSVGHIWLRTVGGGDWLIQLAADHMVIKASKRHKYAEYESKDNSKVGEAEGI